MRIDDIIKTMSLEEKASLCSGKDFWNLKSIDRLNIPSIMITDGPHGLRKQVGKADHVGLNESVPATCFPTAATTASSWDRELLKEIGEALGEECLQEGVSVILGPGANIKRSPLCGRNFEYISEDPYVTGELAASLINGIQSKGIGTSLKHFAVNNQERNRMTIDAVIDERTLREIYLSGFEIAVKKSQPWTVMSAYNKVNGTYCSENKKLLNDILRKEWGFQGVVVTDWGACNDRVEGLEAGLDLEMPASQGINDEAIITAVKNGQLDETVLDKTVERLLGMILKAEENKRPDFRYDKKLHHNLAKKAAAQSAVLLKNKDQILPLNKTSKIAVIGEFVKKPRYQGAGSSLIRPTKLEIIFDELTKKEINFSFARGYDVNNDKPDNILIEEACSISKDAEAVIVFAGLTEKYECEGFDREHMEMPEAHNELIKAVARVNSKIIVVLSGGAPVEMPWIDEVKGLLNSYLGGQAGASAVIDIIFGDVNPSGRLSETYPIKLSQSPCFDFFSKSESTAEYRESIYVGYRYYDTAGIEVLFPFGHGLSYTEFEYNDLRISESSIIDTEELKVSAEIKNIGKVPGAEVVQLYVGDEDAKVFRPRKELKGFEKVFLKPGESRTVEFILDNRSFAYYNAAINDWHIEDGIFNIFLGSSIKDIRLQTSVYVKSSSGEVKALDYKNIAASYFNIKNGSFEIPDRDFITIYGRELPSSKKRAEMEFTLNSTLRDISTTFLGSILVNIMKAKAKKVTGSGKNDNSTNKLIEVMLLESPLRSVVMMSNGQVSMNVMKGLLKLVNGRYLSGIRMLLSALLQDKKKNSKQKKAAGNTVLDSKADKNLPI